MANSKIIAQKLLEIGAVKLNLHEPYTWASGWKSPIYCDNRKSLSHPVVRDLIKTEMSTEIFQEYPDADMIAGVATAGIPHGVLVADLLKMPFIYVRSAPKKHGLTNQIEGDIGQGKDVIVVEDLISTGGSSMQAIEALRDAGLEVRALFSIFNYGFPQSAELFAQNNVTWASLTDYETLIQVALEMGMVTEDQLQSLQKWRESPDTWNG